MFLCYFPNLPNQFIGLSRLDRRIQVQDKPRILVALQQRLRLVQHIIIRTNLCLHCLTQRQRLQIIMQKIHQVDNRHLVIIDLGQFL